MPGRSRSYNDSLIFNRLLHEYEAESNVGIGSDLLGAAVVHAHQDPDIVRVAKEVAANTKHSMMRIIAESFLVEESLWSVPNSPKEYDSRIQIAKIKAILKREPRNSVRWVDLAREYLVLGHREHSVKSMRIALALTPNDRFAVRSAAAMYAQSGDFEQAVDLLGRAPNLKSDPWLLAAFVALSDLSDSRQLGMREARRALEFDQPPSHLSELAAAVGTIELGSGTTRRGRQLLRRSADDGTENSLAQVEWVSYRTNDALIDFVPLDVPKVFEAQARRAASDARWTDALNHSKQWRADQPFSIDALRFQSSCACEAEDWNAVSRVSTQGLRMHPDDTTLLNNRAFARSETNDLIGAIQDLVRARNVDAADKPRTILAATEGLLFFRIGNVGVGRTRYEAAIGSFQRTQQRDLAAKAALMLAREEVLAGTPLATAAWERAKKLVETSKRNDVVNLRERVEALIGTSSSPPPSPSPEIELGIASLASEPTDIGSEY